VKKKEGRALLRRKERGHEIPAGEEEHTWASQKCADYQGGLTPNGELGAPKKKKKIGKLLEKKKN